MDFEQLFADVNSKVVETFPTSFQLEVAENDVRTFQGVYKDNYEEFDVEKGLKVLVDVPNIRVCLVNFPVGSVVYNAKIFALKGKNYKIREVKTDTYQMARILLTEVK